jgi:putative membrane protein
MKYKTSQLRPAMTLALSAMFLLISNASAEDKKSSLNSSDEKFVKHEAAAGMAVVKIAELGARKAQSPDIKVFAAMLVTEHTKSNTELKMLAANKAVEISTVIDPKHADTYQELEKSSGAEFDKEFLAELESGHEKCVASFESASRDTQDSDLKTWVDKTLPVLKAHYEKIKGLSTSVTAKVMAEPDNTARNARDREGRTLTAFDQGSSKYDTETTAKVRREILDAENMSITAQNVKIITNNGRIALRGPVNTAEEKRLIGEIANRNVTASHVDNQLEVKSTSGN